MKNKISITLDDKISKSLKEKFKDDDDAIQSFIFKAIDTELKKCAEEKPVPNDKSEGLENYLKSGNTGSRDYGIKGQGW